MPTRIFIPLNKMRFVIGPNNIQGLLDPSEERAYKLHSHTLEPHQCGSILVQHINAPIESVWSIVQAFDKPQVYKKFIQTCNMTKGDGGVGSVREVYLISGTPQHQVSNGLSFLMMRHTFSVSGFLQDVIGCRTTGQ